MKKYLISIAFVFIALFSVLFIYKFSTIILFSLIFMAGFFLGSSRIVEKVSEIVPARVFVVKDDSSSVSVYSNYLEAGRHLAKEFESNNENCRVKVCEIKHYFKN